MFVGVSRAVDNKFSFAAEVQRFSININLSDKDGTVARKSYVARTRAIATFSDARAKFARRRDFCIAADRNISDGAIVARTDCRAFFRIRLQRAAVD